MDGLRYIRSEPLLLSVIFIEAFISLFGINQVFLTIFAKYILDVLNVIDEDEVILNLKDQNHSCLLTVGEDKDYRSIVMPMRL